MKNKNLLQILAALLLIASLAACSNSTTETAEPVTVSQSSVITVEETDTTTAVQSQSAELVNLDQDDYDDEDYAVVQSSEADTMIQLQGGQISVEGSGVTVNQSTAAITAAGTYSISGSLDDGQIIVETADEGFVMLVLNGASITSLTSAPIYVRNADKVILTLEAGTSNQVSDGTAYVLNEEDEPNAAIFSKSDLTINGTGSLNVTANFNNGIASKDDLKIMSGTITVNAANDGIKGRDSVAIKDGAIVINAGGDGVQSNNDTELDEGNVFIDSGSIQITAELDGVQAENTLVVNGGNLSITTGGGSSNGTHISQQWGDWDMRNQETDVSSEISIKGLKAGVNVIINGGVFNINAADDTIHSNDTIQIYAGDFQLASGDDGIHADTALIISDGNINITESYEGLESDSIQLNGGTIQVIASDDGVNGSDGSGGGMNMGGGPGGGFETGNSSLVINGGYLYVDAGGDGIDINGPIEMFDGIVLVNGPTNNGNGALDYAGSFSVNGGFLIAVGSSGMAQAPSEDSSQFAVSYVFDSIQPTGTTVHIQSQSGEEILTFTAAKEFQALAISSSDLVNGETYLVFTGGNVSGDTTGGLLIDGTYSGGTQVGSFSISSVVTYVGTAGGGFPREPGGGGGPGGKPNRGP